MPNIARPINRAIPERTGNAQKTRVLLLRQPIKSVRKDDEVSRAGFRVMLGVVITVGIVGVTLLIGHLGFRLGFAPMLGLPELLTEPGGGLTTGVVIMMTLPLRIVEAGVAQPMWLMLAFVFVLAPGGWLASVRPQVKGGPRPATLTVVNAWAASVAAALAAGLLVAYVVAPFRAVWTAPLPSDLARVPAWLDNWSVAGGIDALAVLAAALWMVLAFRVTVPLWMKSISVAAAIFALAVATVAMSMTNATIVHLQADRSIIEFGGGADASPSILLGYTRHHAGVMRIDEEGGITVELFDVPTQFQATGRTSIAEELIANYQPPLE